MGIPKKSRKGKKAWRKNIDTKEVEDFITEESHKQIRAPPVQSLKDEDLFVVDKEADDAAVPAAIRKRQQHQQKLLRPQLILASHKDGIKPLHVPTKHKAKGPARPLPGSIPGGPAAAAAAEAGAAAAAATAAALKGRRKPVRRRGLKVTDIWSAPAEDADKDWAAPTSGQDLIRLGKRKQQPQQQSSDATAAEADTAVEKMAAAAAAAVPTAKRSKRRMQSAVPVRAVEVDAPGCSFNPDPEAHQDALAAAVAAEYRKQLAQELAPKAPSQYAPAGFKPQDELEALLVDAEEDEEAEDEQAAAAQQLPRLPGLVDENAIALDDDSDEEGAAAAGADAAAAGAGGAVGEATEAVGVAAAGVTAAGSKAVRHADRKSRKDRNREARRKQQEAEAAAKAAIKQQRRELDRLDELQEALQQEEQEKAAVRERRQVIAAERAASQPPKLGKHRYEEAAVAVLTSDEATGSLRELKPCFNLTADRFKALQKRGLVEPRKPAGHKTGKRIAYVAGERRERAQERQQEIEDIKKARKKAAKAGTAEAAAAVVAMAEGQGKKRRKQKQQQQQQQQQAQQVQLPPGSILPLEVAVGGDSL